MLSELYAWQRQLNDRPWPPAASSASSAPLRARAVLSWEAASPLSLPSLSTSSKAAAAAAKNRGNAFYQRGDMQSAITEYTHAIELDSSTPAFYTNRALAFFKLKRFAECEADCSAALAIDPKNIKAILRRGNCRAEMGKLQDAVNDLMYARTLDPTDASIRADALRIERLAAAAKSVSKPTSTRRRLIVEQVSDDDEPTETKPVSSSSSSSSAVSAVGKTVDKNVGKSVSAGTTGSTGITIGSTGGSIKKPLIQEISDTTNETTDTDTDTSTTTSTTTASTTTSIGVSTDTFTSSTSTTTIPSSSTTSTTHTTTIPSTSTTTIPSSTTTSTTTPTSTTTDTTDTTIPSTTTSTTITTTDTSTLTIPALSVPLPKSSFELEKVFRAIRRSPPQIAALLLALPLDAYQGVFKESIDAERLVACMDAIKSRVMVSRDADRAVGIVEAIVSLKRFDMAVMFLTEGQKGDIREMLSHGLFDDKREVLMKAFRL